MNSLNIVLVFVLAYLLGSIPAAVWIGKQFHNLDVRQHGSGNAGTSNVIRVLGWKTGIPVLLIDVAKGWLAAMLPVFFNLAEPGSGLMTNLQFRGGKGVASFFGYCWLYSLSLQFVASVFSLLCC